MGVPFSQKVRVGAYVVKQHLTNVRRYPLVLMLEPLFRCNLACAGCGKIDYPSEILNKRISVEDAVNAAEECGAPIVSIAGGEPLIHKEIDQIVVELIKRKKFVYLCTNALLLEKHLDRFTPSKFLTFSIHLDGEKADHDAAVLDVARRDGGCRRLPRSGQKPRRSRRRQGRGLDGARRSLRPR